MAATKHVISLKKIATTCDEVCGVLRALSHPGRLLVLGHLTNSPKTVTELQELCDISQSQLSQFLNRMKAEGLVIDDRQGKFKYYRVSDPKIAELILSLQRIFCR